MGNLTIHFQWAISHPVALLKCSCAKIGSNALGKKRVDGRVVGWKCARFSSLFLYLGVKCIEMHDFLTLNELKHYTF